jgi:hypothetical protein
MPTRKRYRCRFCDLTLPAWLLVPQVPNGAMLFGHLGRQHPTEVGAFLAQMHITEDMGLVAAQAFEVIEDHQLEDDEGRKR